jgi:hypothetical protein
MLVDALTTLESTKASPEVLRKQTTADINLPFFAPGNRFRAQERLYVSESLLLFLVILRYDLDPKQRIWNIRLRR